MLALAYAAHHPGTVGPLALIGCGTFDKDSRIKMKQTLVERSDKKLGKQFHNLERDSTDPTESLLGRVKLIESLMTYEVDESVQDKYEPESFDLRAHEETWQDMLQQQEEGVYPSAFAVIKQPVLMIHGKYDPHPGRMIYRSLKSFMPHIEFHELEKCGHSPWVEKHARSEFFELLIRWLKDKTLSWEPDQ
jgi:pimeloyl-ACP methyl ester carboxylesterase